MKLFHFLYPCNLEQAFQHSSSLTLSEDLVKEKPQPPTVLSGKVCPAHSGLSECKEPRSFRAGIGLSEMQFFR